MAAKSAAIGQDKVEQKEEVKGEAKEEVKEEAKGEAKDEEKMETLSAAPSQNSGGGEPCDVPIAHKDKAIPWTAEELKEFVLPNF